MRIYNRWYEKTWFWIKKYQDVIVSIITGIGLGVLFAWSYCFFIDGGK